MSTMFKRVLTIEDLSCFGKCSIGVALPIISAFGLECDVLPTSVFSTHTASYFRQYQVRDLTDSILPFVEHWKELGISFDCIYVGYLSEGRQTTEVVAALKELVNEKTLLFVDPAMADNGIMYGGMTKKHVEEMRPLCLKADFIAPNFTEACFLSGLEEENTPDGAKRVVEKLQRDGCGGVVVTGVIDGEKIGAVGRRSPSDGFCEKYHSRRRDMHGTGDVFSSAFIGKYLICGDFDESMSFAVDFVNAAIADTEGCEGHYYGVRFEPSLARIMRDIDN